jgi:hypothetical protein
MPTATVGVNNQKTGPAKPATLRHHCDVEYRSVSRMMLAEQPVWRARATITIQTGDA